MTAKHICLDITSVFLDRFCCGDFVPFLFELEVVNTNWKLLFSAGMKCRFSPDSIQVYTALIATLDKGKQYKQQQNGLSTLPKVPPGKEKGGIFA